MGTITVTAAAKTAHPVSKSISVEQAGFVIPKFTVSFNANGGSGSTSRNIEKNSPIGTLPTVARSGYSLIGWFTEKEGGTKIAESTKVTKDAAYFAHWLYVGSADDATIVTKLKSAYVANADGTFALNMSTLVGSTSIPKLTVKGLPSGLKYDSKTMTISGKATKPGKYTVTVSATNATVKQPVTATFDIVVPNLASDVLPWLEQDIDAYGVVTCGVAFDPGLVDCSIEDGWTVKAAGLPTGLKLVQDKTTGAYSITGVPTKAGTYTVTFTASKKGEKSEVATITLVTKALPEWAVGTFSGFVEYSDSLEADIDFGSVTMTVAANGKVSGKMALVGTNYTFSAASYATVTDDGCFVVDAEAKAGKVVRPLRLLVIPCDAPGSSPSLFNARAIGSLDSPLASEILMCRGMWKDKATAAVAKTAIAKWEGVYTLSLDSGDGGEFGIGYLSLTVGKDGNIKATGKLADGTSVSATTPLMYDGETGFLACLYFAPSAYKGGSLAMSIGFNEGEGGVRTLGNSRGIAQWTSRNPQATCDYGEGFDYAIEFTGAYYNKLAKLNEYYEALRLEIATPLLQYTYKDTIIDEDTGKKVTESYLDDADAEETDGELTVTVDEKGVLIVPRATKPVYDKENAEWLYGGVNDGALTLSFTQATGIFKGSYTFWYDYESAYDASTEKSTIVHTSKKVNFEGVLVQGEEPEIRGFYLWDATGTYDDPKTGKEKTYKYKKSYPVYLVRP